MNSEQQLTAEDAERRREKVQFSPRFSALSAVNCCSEAAADFYRKHGFEPVLNDPLKLFLPASLSS